jgi:FkbM family methyltransferase
MNKVRREIDRFINRRIQRCRETWRRRFHPTYDEQLFDAMLQILHIDSCCIDAGAHKGKILRDILTIAPRGHHYAFEPLPHLAEELSRNFPYVTVHACAIADQSQVAAFNYVENAPAYSGLRERIYDRPDPKIVKIEVPVVRLDDVNIEHHIRLIKLDLEGGEYHAIVGASNLIARWRPYLAFEGSNWTTGQYDVSAETVADTLMSWGYRLFTLEQWLRRRPSLSKAQFIARWENGVDYFWLATPAVR